MKTKLLLAAFAALTVVSCGGRKLSDEKISAAYEQKSEKISKALNARIEALEAKDLPEEEMAAKAEKLYDDAVAELSAYAKKIIAKYPDSEAAVKAVGDLQYMVEPDELETLVGMLGDTAREDPSISKIKEAIASKSATAEGMPFVDFTVIQDPDAPETSTVSFSDFIGKGKYILVDFWASWCGPCLRELPNIKAVYEKYAGDDFDLLSVAVWDEPAATRAAAGEHGIVWNQIINAQRIPTDLYGIDGIPQIILFGPDGTIVKRDLRGEGIEAEVAKHVKAK